MDDDDDDNPESKMFLNNPLRIPGCTHPCREHEVDFIISALVYELDKIELLDNLV